MRAGRDNAAECAGCVHFLDDPRRLECCFPGIQALSSAFSSSRGRAGLCELDDVLLDPGPACARFQPRPRPLKAGTHSYGSVTTTGTEPRR
jgi:hypothetical protein